MNSPTLRSTPRLIPLSGMPGAPSEVDWSAFYNQLHGFVAARVRVTSDADDIVQRVIERAMDKAAGTDIENVAGWLFRLARNAIADHYRGQARALNAAADALDATVDPLGGSDAERAQVIACMEPLLNTLDDAEAQLLRWADMEGRSMRSIAEELDISLTATKSRVQRARQEFVRVTRACCAITQDARGRVTELTPHGVSGALACAGCVDRAPKSGRDES